MIDKISGVFVLVCDVCGEAAEEVFSTFDEAVDYKVDEGWKSQRRGSEWEDVCPECKVITKQEPTVIGYAKRVE